MNIFDVTDRVQDPAVDGEERADLLAKNFNECSGDSGGLKQLDIFWEAKHVLSPKYFNRFCARIGYSQKSAEFRMMIDLLAEQYRRLRQILDTGLESFAVFNLLLFSHNGDFSEDVFRLAEATAAVRNADEIVKGNEIGCFTPKTLH
jgi:hypothetical protein